MQQIVRVGSSSALLSVGRQQQPLANQHGSTYTVITSTLVSLYRYHDTAGTLQHCTTVPLLLRERENFTGPFHRCDLCNTQAVGFDCPRFGAIRAQYSNLFQDAEGSMRLFIWHEDQKAVSHCLAAILQMAQT